MKRDQFYNFINLGSTAQASLGITLWENVTRAACNETVNVLTGLINRSYC